MARCIRSSDCVIYALLLLGARTSLLFVCVPLSLAYVVALATCVKLASGGTFSFSWIMVAGAFRVRPRACAVRLEARAARAAPARPEGEGRARTPRRRDHHTGPCRSGMPSTATPGLHELVSGALLPGVMGLKRAAVQSGGPRVLAASRRSTRLR